MRLVFSVCLCLSLVTGVATAEERRWLPKRTADGHIDLQGVWAHTNLTPLERPPEFKANVMTPVEAAQFKQKMDARADDLSRPNEPSWFFDAKRVETVRGELRSSIIVEPASGAIPGNALYKEIIATAKADVLTAFDGPEQRPGAERCLTAVSAAPPTQLVPASDLRHIVQTPAAIVIASEELHEARVVRLNSQHVPAVIASWLGDSIGWWEGDTLVVETKHFSAAGMLRQGPNNAFVIAPTTTVTERFTRYSESEMSYAFTVDDPVYYTQVWSGETRFQLSGDRMLEYACHEGNYSLGFALQSARALEGDTRQTPLRNVSTGGALTTE